MEAQMQAVGVSVPRAECTSTPRAFDSNGVGSAPSHQGCGGSIAQPTSVRARSPIGRRRHLEVVNSAGSNPAVRTNATVAQLVGGSGFKPRAAVSVRIGPVAPRGRSARAEAASLNLALVSVQIGPPARVPFRSAGCNPADYETERQASRGSTPRRPTISLQKEMPT
jgi:hypothetical protein